MLKQKEFLKCTFMLKVYRFVKTVAAAVIYLAAPPQTPALATPSVSAS
jgi:hypothetical protein